jgi:hypothetical protein
MWRLAVLLWVIMGTVFAGLLVMVVLLVPGLAVQAMKLIPIAAVVGAILAVPFSFVAAKAIAARTA